MEENMMIAFGPVPSRRLGRSIGINNIPPKTCTYSCIYCQLGRTIKMQVERQKYYEPKYILHAVEEKVIKTRRAGEKIDYLTFVADGEPTLDINLGQEIDLLKILDIPIAVITNSSLIYQQDVRKDLMAANWISLKADAVDEDIWRRIDRPHRKIELGSILEGSLEFAKCYKGKLMTETMLVANVNDNEQSLRQVADYLSRIRPAKAYISIPTRPTTEKWAQVPEEHAVNLAYQILNEKVAHVEYLTGYEGDEFSVTGNVEEDLLSITSVHPMRKDAINTFLEQANADWTVVHQLISQNKLIEVEYGGYKYYLRRFKK